MYHYYILYYCISHYYPGSLLLLTLLSVPPTQPLRCYTDLASTKVLKECFGFSFQKNWFIPFWTNISANNVFSLRAPLWSVEWIQAGDFLLCPKKRQIDKSIQKQKCQNWNERKVFNFKSKLWKSRFTKCLTIQSIGGQISISNFKGCPG